MSEIIIGGSGFIAGHLLDVLLSHGHVVVATVRSEGKAKLIRRLYPDVPENKLSFVIVEDIAQDGAFDRAVVSDPPFDAVLHPASPVLVNVKDVRKELLDPAIKGTTGILKSVKNHAPSVKRVVVTSSFAAVWNRSKGNWAGKTYTEEDWADVTAEEAVTSLEPSYEYQASKKEAEIAAWVFMEREKPRFDLTVIIPPMVDGFVKYAETIDQVNGSNRPIVALLNGQWKDEIPETRVPMWTDVRDVALAHVLALENAWATNRRILCVAGSHCYRDIVDVVRMHFPEYGYALPAPNVGGGHAPQELYTIDRTGAQQLGLRCQSLSSCIGDLVRSIQPLLARNQ